MYNQNQIRVFTDDAENPTRYCIEYIHGSFIVIDKHDSDSMPTFTHTLPQGFTSVALMDVSKVKDDIFDLAEIKTICFIDPAKPKDERCIFEHNISTLLSDLNHYLNSGWVLEQITDCGISLMPL